MRARSNAIAALAGLWLWLQVQPAQAYCRTSVCDGEEAGTLCMPSQPGDCGTALAWNRRCIGFSMQQRGSVQIDVTRTQTLMQRAFDSWQTANCEHGNGSTPTIGLQITTLPQVECDQVEYNQSGGNANTVIFRDDTWPYQGQDSTLALTTVTYSLETGEIFDADLEINSTASTALTTSDTNVQIDLLSILTHEAGHMLGLAHSADEDATMTAAYLPGELNLRTLEIDDVNGICASYPPNTNSNTAQCDPAPRHGFKSSCGPGDDTGSGGCDCSLPANPHKPDHGWVSLLLAGLIAFRRRLRHLRH